MANQKPDRSSAGSGRELGGDLGANAQEKAGATAGDPAATGDARGPGFSARSLLSSWFGLIRARSALAVLELADARDALLRVLFLGAAALLLGAFALACLTALVIALLWEPMGWGVLLLLLAVYAMLAFWLLQRAIGIVASGRIGLKDTMEELRKDRNALLGEEQP